MTPSHDSPPAGYAPCTRERGHKGPCALSLSTDAPLMTVADAERDRIIEALGPHQPAWQYDDDLAGAVSRLRSEVERVTKDAERMDWLQEQVRCPNPDKDSAYQTCIGEVVLSGSWTDVTVEVGNAIAKGEGPTLREAIDAARGAVRGDAAIREDAPSEYEIDTRKGFVGAAVQPPADREPPSVTDADVTQAIHTFYLSPDDLIDENNADRLRRVLEDYASRRPAPADEQEPGIRESVGRLWDLAEGRRGYSEGGAGEQTRADLRTVLNRAART